MALSCNPAFIRLGLPIQSGYRSAWSGLKDLAPSISMSTTPEPPRIEHKYLRSGLVRAGMDPDFANLAFTYLGRFSTGSVS